MEYIIGSLNAKRFTGVGKHDINKIAEIIVTECFDIIALQEVMRAQALDYLVRRLPQGWKYGFGQSGYSGASAYGMGFLWNSKRLRECSKSSLPMIYDRYSKHVQMVRNPLYGRFTPSGLGGGFFEMRLLSIHLCWSTNGVQDYKQRLDEYNLVTNEIYEKVSNRRYGNNMPAYTIVLGDYNLAMAECNRHPGAAQTVQREKTTMGNYGYVSDYDHFSYKQSRFAGAYVSEARVDSVNSYTNGDFIKHAEVISDHAPVKLILNLNP